MKEFFKTHALATGGAVGWFLGRVLNLSPTMEHVWEGLIGAAVIAFIGGLAVSMTKKNKKAKKDE